MSGKIYRGIEKEMSVSSIFLSLNVSYELLWVIGMSVLRAKLLCFFVDSCGAAAWGKKKYKHKREVSLK